MSPEAFGKCMTLLHTKAHMDPQDKGKTLHNHSRHSTTDSSLVQHATGPDLIVSCFKTIVSKFSASFNCDFD